MPTDFRAVVRAALQDRGIAQRELSRRLDIPIVSLNGWLKGRSSLTSDTLQRIADHLGLDLIDTLAKRRRNR
jgi:transcriptional regulator with XRE-family HTH domain